MLLPGEEKSGGVPHDDERRAEATAGSCIAYASCYATAYTRALWPMLPAYATFLRERYAVPGTDTAYRSTRKKLRRCARSHARYST
eukprot:2006393-Rhodomonas_salina.1